MKEPHSRDMESKMADRDKIQTISMDVFNLDLNQQELTGGSVVGIGVASLLTAQYHQRENYIVFRKY